MNDFKLGDNVVHAKGNVPRTGSIIDASDKAGFWGWTGSPLAFYGVHHYFEWLDNAWPYLTLINSND